MTNKTEDKFYFSRLGKKDMMAREVIARKGNKRIELSGPYGDGRWSVTVMAEEKPVVPGEVNERFVQLKWYSTEATARRAASKMLSSRPGKPERFGNILSADLDYAISEIRKDMNHMTKVMQDIIKKNPLDSGWIWATDSLHNGLLDFIDRTRGVLKHKDSQVQAKAKKAVSEVRAFLDKWQKMQARSRSGKAPFARPGKPERFAEINVIDQLMRLAMRDGMADRMRPELDRILGAGSFDRLFASYKTALGASQLKELLKQGKSVPEAWDEYFGRGSWKKFTDNLHSQLRAKVRASRPGKPDTFDASSLERGDFKDASKSPMLGNLLSEKVMPEGGWRAVQVGSDTLVISFEDADLARDFGRRASTKGYSATSPVATTGRYWNVEVKHGK